MKKIVFLLLLALPAVSLKAQIKALTDNGKQVLLNEDGTWKYYNDSASEADSGTADSIRINSHAFSRAFSASFLVKSTVLNVGVYIDPSRCLFFAHKDNEINPEYRFSLKNGNAYAIFITEKTAIDLSYMPGIALLNAEKEAADARVIKKEYRMVNNKKVMMIEMKATIKDIKFVYLGYYYSNDNGTVQFITFTGENTFEKVKGEMETLLNGFVEIEK